MTSLRRTPLVLAVASAFSFAALSAQAADVLIGSELVPSTVEAEATWDADWAGKILGDAEDKVVTVKPGEEGSPANVSIKEKGDLTIDISGTDAPDLVFSGAGLSLVGGKLTLGSDLTIQDNGALSFKGASALEIEKNTTLTLSDGTHDFALGTSADASIENAGTIVLKDSANFNISGVADEATAEEKLDVINFGNVTVEGGSTLTNANTGYTVATEKSSDKSDGSSGAEEGATDGEASETLSRVEFGTVTVTGEGSKFVNAAGAIDSGETLVLKDGGSAEILGSSTWEAVSVDLSGDKKIALGKDEGGDGWKFSVGHLAIAHAGTGLSDVVSEKGKGEWSVSDALTITSFGSSDGKSASFTLSSTDKDHIGDGLDITVGSRLSANDVEFKSSGDASQPSLGIKTDADILTAGTFKVTGFAGTWTADQNESAGSEGAAGGDEEGAASQSEEAQKGEWSYQHFGAITVNDNMTFVFDSNKTTLPDNAAEPYHAAVVVDSLSLNGSSIAASYDVPVESIAAFVQAKLEEKEIKDKIDYSDWTEENLTEKLQALEEKYGIEYFSLLDALADAKESLDGKISGEFFTKPAVNAAQGQIKDSDLSIGKLSFGMNEVKKDIGDVSALLGKYAPDEDEGGSSESGSDSGNAGAGTGLPGGNEGRADEEKPAEKPTYSESLTGELGAPELTIAGSTVEVGTLSMSTGVIDANGSNLIVEKVDGKISGEIYFKEGFLGLNSVTSAADLKTAASSGDGESAAKATAGNTLDVGAPVVIGAAGKLVIGSSQVDAEKVSDVSNADGALVYFADDAEITFDASRFGTTALFSAELAQSGEAAGKTSGKGSVVVADGKTVNIKATNLSWGVYNIFDDETFDVTAQEKAFTVDGSEASALWKDRVESAGKITVNEKGQMVVGGATVEGSGLDAVAAKNLVSAVIGGNRDGALDVALVNALMGSGSSIDDVVKTIDSVTGLGAIAGVNAMTVDLLAYTHDMIEHHASTIPLEGAGWWVMPLGGRMEADDLGLGGSTYGYSVDTYGLMGGLDVRVGSDWVVGAAGSYQTGDADSEGDVLDASTDVTNYGLHFWGARHYGDVKVTGTLSWMKTEGDAEMAVLGGKATADVKATAFAASLRADLRKSFGSFELIPHAGVRAAMIDIDDYDIRFNEADLFSVDEDKIVVFEVPVGVTAATSFELQKWTVRPYADVTLRGRFGDTDSSYTLTGSSTKDTIGYDVAGDFAGDLKLGWMSTHKDLNLGMSYGFSAGDAGRQAHRIEATMRVLFD